MNILLQDLRYAFRRIIKSPKVSLVVIVTLALGIGANTAIFSIVNGILLRPLPYPEADRLIRIWPELAYPKGVLLVLRGETKSLKDVAAYTTDSSFSITGDGDPVRVDGSQVSANLFSMLEITTVAGRTFREGEDLAGQDDVVILSHALWASRYGKNPGLIGKQIVVETVPRRVVGIMPAGFQFPGPGVHLWIPVSINKKDSVDLWGLNSMRLLGRLRPGFNEAQAQAELAAFIPRIRVLFPWVMPKSWNDNATVVSLQSLLVGNVRLILLVLFGAVLLVLLVACANIANLLLTSAIAREKEVAVRLALGAGRGRIVQQLITESLLLALLGGAMGLAFAAAGIHFLKSALPASMPRLNEAGLDIHVLAFTFIIAVVTGILFGIFPAMRISSLAVNGSLKASGHRTGIGLRRQRLSSVLAVAEIAVAMVLVTASGLMAKTLWELSRVDLGFQPVRVITARVSPADCRCKLPGWSVHFYDEVLQRIQTLPGVQNVAASSELPLSGMAIEQPINLMDQPLSPGNSPPNVWQHIVTTEYFKTMDISLLAGRQFVDTDREGQPLVAIINQELAERLWPNQNPVGKQIKPVWQKEWRTVVGVVRNVHGDALSKGPGMEMYFPFAQNPRAAMALLVRTRAGARLDAADFRNVVGAVDRDVPVDDLRPMEQVISDSIAAPRSTTWMLGAFAMLALALGVLGIYSVISQMVNLRTREIGVRIACGARIDQILYLILGKAVLLTLIGVASGILGSLIGLRALRSLLFGVSVTDSFTFFLVSLVLTAISLLASYIPAHRATKLDPVIALREE
jgi:predicted permease